DTEWTAERVCINVRLRDVTMIFLDVQQVSCMEGLKPLETRQFTVTYTGMIPPRLFPIQGEAKVDYVKWTKGGDAEWFRRWSGKTESSGSWTRASFRTRARSWPAANTGR